MANTNRNTVITSAVQEDSEDGGRQYRSFWTGKRWAVEYPAAKKYTVSEARRVCKTTSFDRVVQMTVDYGTEDEHVAL